MKAHAIPRLLLAVALLALLTACAHRNPLAKWERSPNFDDRRPVLVVLHYTAGKTAEAEAALEQEITAMSSPAALAATASRMASRWRNGCARPSMRRCRCRRSCST